MAGRAVARGGGALFGRHIAAAMLGLIGVMRFCAILLLGLLAGCVAPGGERSVPSSATPVQVAPGILPLTLEQERRIGA